MATLELQVWELSTYEATLASKASQQQEEVADWERWDDDGFGAAALPRMAWQERSAGGGAAGGGGASGALLEVLVRTRGGGKDVGGGAQRQGRRGAMSELLTGQVGRCLEFPYQMGGWSPNRSQPTYNKPCINLAVGFL